MAVAQRSATGQGVNLRSLRRWRLRDPRLAAVLAGPDLAAIGSARHPGRLTLVESDLEHRVRYRRADIDLGPTVTAVAAAQQYAKIAHEAGAGGEPKVARVAGNLADVAGIDLSFDIER